MIRPRTTWKAGLWLAYVALVAAGLEFAVRAAGLEQRLLAPLLYYQHDQLSLHRPSRDPARIFELRPGASTRLGVSYTINSMGMRGRERTRAKPRGVRRIVFLGGSTTFGPGVGDDETYPARLQQLLDKRFPGKFEVWNAGLCAYVLSQEVALATELVERYAPDVLVFQYLNRGRRAFLSGQDFRPYFQQDPGLYAENLPFFPSSRLGRLLFKQSAFVRASVVGLNRPASIPRNNPAFDDESANIASFKAFRDRHAGRVKILAMPLDVKCPEDLAGAGAPSIDLFAREHLPETPYAELFPAHPPACAYRWYADVIAYELGRLVPELFPGGGRPARPTTERYREGVPPPHAVGRRPAFASSCGRVLESTDERASHLLARLTSEHPDDPGLWAGLSDAALRSGDPALAASSLARAEDLKPRGPLAREIRRLRSELGRAGPSAEGRPPTRLESAASSWARQAQSAFDSGNAALALKLAATAEEFRPSDETWARLLVLNGSLGRSSRVLEIGRKLPERWWRDPAVPLACASAANSLGRASEARSFLKRVRDLPFSEDAWIGIAQIERRMGLASEALETLRKAAGLRPASPRPLVMDAEISASSGDCDRALAALDRARGLLASGNELKHRAALAYQTCRAYPKAAAVLEDLVRLNPTIGVFRKDLGVCRYLMGKTLQAKQDWEAAIKLSPGLDAAYASLAAALEREGLPAEAAAVCRRKPGACR